MPHILKIIFFLCLVTNSLVSQTKKIDSLQLLLKTSSDSAGIKLLLALSDEFTIIGKPLTELFRLESISIYQRINYYDETDIRNYYSELISPSSSFVLRPAEWTHYSKPIANLKGVNYRQFFSIKHNL